MSILSLDDAKRYLKIPAETSDADIQDTIDAAEAIIASEVGGLTVGASTTVRVSAGGSQLVLPSVPVGTVTAIATPGGQTVDISSLTVNQATGIVYFTDGATLFYNDVYDVTYTTGRASVPEPLLQAIRELVKHLWAPKRGLGGGRTQPQPDATPGYLLPYRVEQLIAPYKTMTVA